MVRLGLHPIRDLDPLASHSSLLPVTCIIEESHHIPLGTLLREFLARGHVAPSFNQHQYQINLVYTLPSFFRQAPHKVVHNEPSRPPKEKMVNSNWGPLLTPARRSNH